MTDLERDRPTAIATRSDARRALGRAAELGQLEEAIEGGSAGHPTVVVVLGDAGIGKTTLLETSLARIPDTHITVRATGDEAESDLDFGLIDQLVRSFPLPAEARRRFLPAPGSDPLDVGATLLRAVDALEADRPAVVTIDDAHLADAASLQALTFAARRLYSDRLTILIFGRPELADRLPPGLTRVANATGGVLELRGLDAAAIGELAGELFGDLVPAAAAERLRVFTAGNPLHTRVLLEQLTVDDLLGAAALPAPRSFSSLIAAQLAECSPDARALIVALSILDVPADLAAAAAVAGLGNPLAAVDELRAAGLIDSDHSSSGIHVDFRHAMIAAGVRGDVPVGRRVDLHRLAAGFTTGQESLRHRLAAATGPDPTLEDDLARQAWLDAGRGARRLAAANLEAAASLTGDPLRRQHYLLRAAHHLLIAGQPLGAWAPEIDRFEDGPWRSYVVGRSAMSTGQFDSARPHLERSWAQLEQDHRDEADSEEIAPDVAELLALIAICTLHPDDVLTWARRSAQAGGGGLSATLVCHGIALTGDVRGAAAEIDRLIADQPADSIDADARLARGIAAVWANDLPLARRQLSLARGTERTFLQAVNVAAYLAETYYREGRLAPSIDLAETTVALTDDAQTPWLSPLPRGVAAFALATAGELDRARVHAAVAGEIAVATGQVPARIWAEHAAFRVADVERDQPTLLAIGERMVAAGWETIPEGVHHWRASYTEALCAAGDLDEAARIAAALWSDAERCDDDSVRTDAARAAGSLAIALGRLDEASAAFSGGLQLDPSSIRPLERARLELAAGALLRRQGQRTAAAALLTTAARRFGDAGAMPWLTQCERELVACGLRPAKRSQPPPASSLTAQEGVIARLVADGHSTNREVAAELFISVKTVEHHLSRIYAKLGVRGRMQLAAALAAAHPDAADG